MIERLRSYPRTASTEYSWLPALPEHWRAHRAKVAFREVDERSADGREELLSVSHKTGVTPRSQKTITMFKAASYVGHKMCRPGDVVVNTMWAWMAALGVSAHVGIVSPSYGVYRRRREGDFEPRFLDYLLRAEVYRAEYLRSSRGITTSRLRLYPNDFLQIPFIQPPLEEQRLIVRFLDWHGAMTARMIRAKKRLIDLLKEQKQSIVDRAVTRGIADDVKLKPSEIDWLGDVPRHWEVKKLRRVCRVGAGKGLKRGLGSGDQVTFLPMERVGADGEVDCSEQLPIEAIGSGYSVFRRGDVIVAKITPCFENGKGAFLANLPTDVGFGSSEFIVLRAGNEIEAQFLYLLTASQQFRRLGTEAMTGSAGQQRVPPDFIKDYVAAIPPRDEQASICRFADQTAMMFHRVNETIKSEIALVQEFRTRLIADVVFGQLDVRDVAPDLPDLSAELASNTIDEGDFDDEEVNELEDDEVEAA